MKTLILATAITFTTSLGATLAAPLPAQTGVSAPQDGLIAVRDSKKRKSSKSKKNDMKGMDHSKMPM